MCAKIGVSCIRPAKRRKGQKQLSSRDTIVTQKIGNARIVVEQGNGQMKLSNRYFDGKVPILQTTLVSRLFRNGFMFNNFKVGFVIGNRNGSTNGRPCKGAIRWGGETDKGLVDVRRMPELWATQTERASIRYMTEANPSLSEADASMCLLSGGGARHGNAISKGWSHAMGHCSHFPPGAHTLPAGF